MRAEQPIRVAALVDLPRSPEAGGHVKCWERLAEAAADGELPLDLTVYFSGRNQTETLGPGARMAHLPPLFSTAQLKFLPYVPDHTDLAPYHPRLARELGAYDVIHTTDAFFAFARTAEGVSRRRGIPLTTSFHTDTPSYTRIFTRQTIEARFGASWPARKLIDDWQVPERQGRRMDQRLVQHVRRCSFVAATRSEDTVMAQGILGRSRVGHLRLGIDKRLFGPQRADRAGVEARYGLPKGEILVLFVGRLDVGKNIHTLVDAIASLRAEGVPLHLITAGVGPAEPDIRRKLGAGATIAGYVQPGELARLYASVDLVALSSEVEIRSMVGVEAMASGCPVLVSQKSGVAELFEHTPAMRVVDSGAAAWAQALRETAASASARHLMRGAALDYSTRHLAPWRDVLDEDLFALWREAAHAPAAELIA
ncbi:MAG TPA: glycosyltransferase [Caulobacteraceae bacterium]|jgi:glycosyltransferase involved in cell wall biosynthesis|nr:glycosyltransferase [Caulobacteraceae bacterium]